VWYAAVSTCSAQQQHTLDEYDVRKQPKDKAFVEYVLHLVDAEDSLPVEHCSVYLKLALAQQHEG